MDSISTINALKAVIAGLPTGAPAADQYAIICNSDGTPAKKYPARQLIQDAATAGNGTSVCSTAATTQAKTVTVTDFILLKNGIVSVRFQHGIKVAGATLNVSSTGAKPITVGGIALPADVIGENMTVLLQYDGANWGIVSVLQASANDELLVDLGLPSGILWATRNIDVTQPNGFAASPFQYECSFVSWGNTEMFNPISASAFGHDFGTWDNSKNATEDGYLPDSIYGQTPGCALTADLGNGYDAACINLGKPWRMPTTAEFAELFANIDYIDANGDVIAAGTTDKRCNYNGVMGLRLRSKINGKEIFFACSGDGNGTSWNNRGSYGYYWSASFISARYARGLNFGSGGVYPQNDNCRCYGFAVRPVQ